MCVRLHVSSCDHVCAFACMQARGQCWVSSSIAVFFIFRKGLSLNPEPIDLARLAGQQAQRCCCFLPQPCLSTQLLLTELCQNGPVSHRECFDLLTEQKYSSIVNELSETLTSFRPVDYNMYNALLPSGYSFVLALCFQDAFQKQFEIFFSK